ncbi:MAG: hypothetical protein JRF63_14320 [Deltaproteobacteria bacterium]|nr:hypothetical protein [Deltaproteobacteria bacterium]
MRAIYRRLMRRRVEAPLRIRVGGSSGPRPTMDDPIEMTSEIIDLSIKTAAFEARFPILAERSRQRLNAAGGVKTEDC